MKYSSNKIFKRFISFFIRLGVIIHEFSHLLFAFLFGAKIKSVDLFSRTGGQVVFSTKDYISNLAFHRGNKFIYIIRLIINRFGIFLSSMGPLIVGIFLNILLLNYVSGKHIFSIQAQLDYTALFSLLLSSPFSLIIVAIYTLVFIPSFILSRQDISNFFFYRGQNIFASAVGSIINIGAFITFLLIAVLRFDYIKYFALFYSASFVLTLIIFLLFKGISIISKKHILLS